MATILVVDDRPEDREYLGTLLNDRSYRVLQAADGAEALDQVKNEKPDLVISDILMPTMDGFELVRSLRALPELARVPVMFYCAPYHEREAKALADACGIARIVSKPAEPPELLSAIKALLEGLPPLPPPPDIQEEHHRLVADKLYQKNRELEISNQRLTALIDLSLRLGNERDPRPLLQGFADAARKIISARYALVGTYNGSQQVLHLRASGYGQAASPVLAPGPGTTLYRVYMDRQGLRQAGPIDPGGFGLPADHPPVRSLLAVPIASLAHPYGWLFLANKVGLDEFTPEDERQAGILGTQVGRIYENGSLYHEAKQRAAQLERETVERQKTEEALRLRDRGIQALTQGILITDATQPDNPIIYFSPGFARLTGYSTEEALGRNCRFLQGKDTDPDAVAKLREAIRTGQPCSLEILNYKKDGTSFWNQLSLSPLHDDQGLLTHFVGIQADITQRRKLEEQFRQSQKMEAVGRLAGGIAHDFNNLLTVINGYSEILLGSLLQGDPLRDPIEQIKRSGDRAATLTHQLLAFSRKQMLVPVLLDLNALVTEMEKMLHRVIGEDIELIATLDPNLRRVKADAGQIEQVVMNLVINARDAMPKGGQLTIATRNRVLDDAYVARHSYVHPGEYVELTVADTGVGMDAAVQARIFEPFFTTKGERGTGLGLATVYGIVKQSQGYIEVESTPGQGSRFLIQLPRSLDVTRAAHSPHGTRKTARGSETILLVEDEEGVRTLTRMILSSAGYRVLEAASGEQGLHFGQNHSGPIHLLVTDVVMPRMSGPQLVQRLAQFRPSLRSLYLSGYTDDAIVQQGIISPGTLFLNKPFTLDGLLRKVREALET